MSKKKTPSPRGKAGLLGVGLDNDDGHKRVTTSENFAIYGGKAETHERITETFMKTFEELKARGKRLEQAEPKEIAEILHKSMPR